MGKGLLAWWRRRIMARGLAGAALFAVPVAVAAAIGFGTSLSGVAGGLSAVTNGPDAVPVSAQTGPKGLNDAVAALTKPSATQGSSGDGSDGSGGNTGTGTTRGGSGGTSDTTGTNGTSGGSGGTGGNTGVSLPTISTPTTSVPLPGTGGSTGDTTNQIDSTVNNVLGGVGNTVNGLLGK
jgi:hypothetical protein